MLKPRHPEKINNPINPIKKKPNWIRTKIIDLQYVKKLAAQIFQNVGVKSMLRL